MREQNKKLVTAWVAVGLVVATVGAALAARPGPSAADSACTIEDWRWSYSRNEFFTHGGFIEIDGVVVDYPAKQFPMIYIRMYDGPKGDQYIGNESAMIEPGGTFSLMADARRPAASKLSIKYSCG